MNTLIRNFMLA